MAGSEDVVLAVAEGAWVSQPATVQLAGGRQATYEVLGTGEPLLWIEGGPGFPADLGRPDVALLADRFCCYLIDAPGCGGSTPPAERRDWDHLGHARFFDEVRQALGLGPVTVMGHSWGGLIALTYATLIPAAVARCIVVDGYAGDSSVDLAEADAEQQAAFQRLAHYPWFPDALRLRQAFLAPPADPAAPPPQDPQGLRWRLYFADPERPSSLAHAERLVRAESRFNREVMEVWESDGLYASVDITPLLPRIAWPTLVLVGRHDPVCGPAWARPLVAGVSDATLVVFADSGHVPAYEEPEGFRRAVLDWCSAQPRNDLLGPGGVVAILGFVAATVGVSLAVAFTLQAAGVSSPATIAVSVAAVLLVVGGPLLMRHLQGRMLANRSGSRR